MAGARPTPTVGEADSPYADPVQIVDFTDTTFLKETQNHVLLTEIRKPLRVYWNVPTSTTCKTKGIHFENLYEKYGIIQNKHDQFEGDQSTILYLDPLFKNNDGTKKFTSKGTSNASFEEFLDTFRDILTMKIPDENFAGLGVIDYDMWRPIFCPNYNARAAYMNMFIELEQQKQPSYMKSQKRKEAHDKFVAAAESFMLRLLSLAKELRPNAVWGYYGFPHCFNVTPSDTMNETCSTDAQHDNDRLSWMWSESNALYPSMFTTQMLSNNQLASQVQGRVTETLRRKHSEALTFFYFGFSYSEGPFLTQQDVEIYLKTIYNSDADGMIIWGSSNEVNTKVKCEALKKYLQSTLGPIIFRYTKFTNEITEKKENRTGRNLETIEYKKNNRKEAEVIDKLPGIIQNRERPEETAIRKPFRVYWNVPTNMTCKSKGIVFEDLFDKYGIRQNKDDQFDGDQITILYVDRLFPSIQNVNGTEVFTNSGIPQTASIEEHLDKFRDYLIGKIPNEDFAGLGIIDFERWRPIFRQNYNAQAVHTSMSKEIVKKEHPSWTEAQIKNEAMAQFEAAARQFMLETLSLAGGLRPKAVWGYYAFPYCYNLKPDNNMNETCSKDIVRENDRLNWMWSNSSALFPSMYTSRKLLSNQIASMVEGRVTETLRVKRSDALAFSYFRFKYLEDGFMSQNDVEANLKTLYSSEADGMIIWGSSSDVNTKEKCIALTDYLNNTLGPTVSRYTTFTNEITEKFENRIESNLKTVEYYKNNKKEANGNKHLIRIRENRYLSNNNRQLVTKRLSLYPKLFEIDNRLCKNFDWNHSEPVNDTSSSTEVKNNKILYSEYNLAFNAPDETYLKSI